MYIYWYQMNIDINFKHKILWKQITRTSENDWNKMNIWNHDCLNPNENKWCQCHESWQVNLMCPTIPSKCKTNTTCNFIIVIMFSILKHSCIFCGSTSKSGYIIQMQQRQFLDCRPNTSHICFLYGMLQLSQTL